MVVPQVLMNSTLLHRFRVGESGLSYTPRLDEVTFLKIKNVLRNHKVLHEEWKSLQYLTVNERRFQCYHQVDLMRSMFLSTFLCLLNMTICSFGGRNTRFNSCSNGDKLVSSFNFQSILPFKWIRMQRRWNRSRFSWSDFWIRILLIQNLFKFSLVVKLFFTKGSQILVKVKSTSILKNYKMKWQLTRVFVEATWDKI